MESVMAWLAFQKDMERITDFAKGQVSSTIPSSSCRLGGKSAPCHAIYLTPLAEALRDTLVNYFDRSMPGYYNEEGLLHAVETTPSNPL
jgi:uncharacterized FAD-dependent dehydrogenase